MATFDEYIKNRNRRLKRMTVQQRAKSEARQHKKIMDRMDNDWYALEIKKRIQG